MINENIFLINPNSTAAHASAREESPIMRKDIPDLKKQQDSYDEIWAQLSTSGYQAQQHLKNRIFAITEFLTSLNLDNPEILEIGCGFGVLSRELSRFGTTTGMDLSPKGIAIAQRLNPELAFFSGDALTYEFRENSYDIVISSEVIEHIPKESHQHFINVIAKILRPGGFLILTTPNKKLSDHVSNFQLIEEHLFQDDLVALLKTRFDIRQLTTIHRLFPISGHKSKVIQAFRAGLYEFPGLRRWVENPFRNYDKGLYFAVLCQLQPDI
jgi:2-polyprenyl-3-methyl-5-hydroxy-6-metoxy-1,4-benzoquinol methylase